MNKRNIVVQKSMNRIHRKNTAINTTNTRGIKRCRYHLVATQI